MNADPVVRQHFPSVHTPAEAHAEAGRIRAAIDQRGWGFWALELPGVQAFVGCVGLIVTAFEAPFVPCVEIGWRLSRDAWGQGLASEAAAAAVTFAFTVLQLPQLVAITTPSNLPSQRVMHKLGMLRDADGDFDHPRVPVGHPLRRHVLFRLDRPATRGAPP